MTRAALLVFAACLLAAAPAGASERTEARRYAAKLQPRIALTPAERAAIVGDYRARSDLIVRTCMPALQEAARDDGRRVSLVFVYLFHAYDAFYRRQLAWLRQGDARLAAIRTRSPALRRGRAARASSTVILADLLAATGGDFCAMLAAWQASGWRAEPPAVGAVLELLDRAAGRNRSLTRPLARAARVLRRHGASRGQRRALTGEPRCPALDYPETDPVEDALDAEIEPECATGGGGTAR